MVPALSGEDRAVETAILRRLATGEATGHQLLAEVGVSEAMFHAAAIRLWNGFALRGHLADGCCSAPCGPDCVSAGRMDRRWGLTRGAIARLRRTTAEGAE